jgi:hypothetical protein
MLISELILVMGREAIGMRVGHMVCSWSDIGVAMEALASEGGGVGLCWGGCVFVMVSLCVSVSYMSS